jgi:hypothetical protein
VVPGLTRAVVEASRKGENRAFLDLLKRSNMRVCASFSRRLRVRDATNVRPKSRVACMCTAPSLPRNAAAKYGAKHTTSPAAPSTVALLRKVHRALHHRLRLHGNEHLIVLVSGGCESVALLHLLGCLRDSVHWQKRWGRLRLHVLHFDHGLRSV